MLQMEEKDRITISKGHMPTLKKVLAENLKEYDRRLRHEKNSVELLQGHAQVMEYLISLM